MNKPEDEREITGITVHYSNDTTKEIMHGCCVDLTEITEEISVEMLNAAPIDIVRLAYGMLVCVDRMGLMDAFREFAGGRETKGAEKKTARQPQSPSWKTAKTPLEIGFCKFWDIYPGVRRRAKPVCWRKWQAIKPDDAMVEQILHTIQVYSQTSEWIRGYVPMPLTWLNQGRWENVQEVERHGEQ